MVKIIDIDQLIKDLTKVSESLEEACESLADTVALKLVDDMKAEAYEKGSRIGKAYDDNISVTKTKELDTYTYLVELDDKADWAENGMEAHWMGEYLLKGAKSRVIPITNDFNDIANSKRSNNENKQKIANELKEISNIVSAADFRGKSGYNKFKMDSVSGTTAELKPNENEDKVSATTKTFRTITDKDDGSWIHPGSEGAKLLEKLDKEAPAKIDEILQSILDKK